ncbi:proton extrusion protein PcxA [Anabaena cylindrica FACHB-243]|uniref:Proton extrusion protein PxcA n=1 Tax=Anabaena cylindrica (strain ATCC 27899 / PCC 7122) TaxID=272123 RepID=K9ZIX9_ANACC|nr:MULTISPECIES: proton extrusion protein PcxA [Anabaena]AFZ58522.1 envelope membrane protein [Anabaena cylindrica PCC 7122]MBD2416285.1 proton extrusion protein PcxA [Anabaena cylindrica FACHB-243]MBY5283274.1 proton extrusion protein PcxA [Anabaena sp. CCAP 1446/1C]MBY5307955.1 proton extrusion protein PcxA [Anabaena sp. CCAP 1446/1C]MCM2407336.1 proton extrusion protein PcxA [Anabaena sp. CCAP 1446/1C]
MRNSVFSQKIYGFLLAAYRWYLLTPERSLEEAYQTALKIKEIEDQHFQGKKISADSAMYSSTVMDYFEADLKKLLKNARMRLTEFKASRWFSNESKQQAAIKTGIEYPSLALVLEKLGFIDQVIAKYTNDQSEKTPANLTALSTIVADNIVISQPNKPKISVPNNGIKPKRKADATGVLPRSILSTITRLQAELDPESEQDVVQNFRQTQKTTIISIRFILLLIIIPLLTHQIAKAVVVGPLVDHFRGSQTEQIFLNTEMEEEALRELQRFEERIKFENMISNAAPISSEDIEIKMQEKAQEVAEQFQSESANAIKNVFADICSVIAFIWLLIISKSSISVLKDFFDHVVYGLSDSAKAFIIILFTDVFVGFHSPHGWEVILEGISRHWGLPANRDFIFLFIATFPVILDTIFKYWIFRYLNRISPSAVATYHNMNE